MYPKAFLIIVSLFLSCGVVRLVAQEEKTSWERVELNKQIVFDGIGAQTTQFGKIVSKFDKLKVKPELVEHFQSNLKRKEQVEAFLMRFNKETDWLGAAVLLNQIYPKEKFAPVTDFFGFADQTNVPIDLVMNGKSKTIDVSSTTFAAICRDYWKTKLLAKFTEQVKKQ